MGFARTNCSPSRSGYKTRSRYAPGSDMAVDQDEGPLSIIGFLIWRPCLPEACPLDKSLITKKNCSKTAKSKQSPGAGREEPCLDQQHRNQCENRTDTGGCWKLALPKPGEVSFEAQ